MSKKLNIHVRNFLHYHSSIGFWQEILELFGDYIEKISTFNYITGEIINDDLKIVTIYPSKNYVVSDNTLKFGIEKIG